MQTVKVLGKVTLRNGKVVRRTGCALPRHASKLATRLLSSAPIRTSDSVMAHAFRKALA